MIQIYKENEPLTIIKSSSSFQEDYMIIKFMDIITHLYQYEIFKDILDTVATLAKKGLLKFNIQDKNVFDLDEGNCKTIFSDKISDVLGNKFSKQKKYLITIKKIIGEVIIHEIAHMIENEVNEKLNIVDFVKCVGDDIKDLSISNPSLKTAIHNVLIKEVSMYKENQRNSEIFARYFQLFAGSKEVKGYSDGEGYSYSIITLNKAFIKTQNNLKNQFKNILQNKIDLDISKISLNYVKDINSIEHKWSGSKIESFHQKSQTINSQNNNNKKWSKAIKSNSDTIFN